MIIFTDNRKAHDKIVAKYDEYKKIGWSDDNIGVLVMEDCQYQSPEDYPEGTIAAYHVIGEGTAEMKKCADGYWRFRRFGDHSFAREGDLSDANGRSIIHAFVTFNPDWFRGL